jgi:hypothetical protein
MSPHCSSVTCHGHVTGSVSLFLLPSFSAADISELVPSTCTVFQREPISVAPTVTLDHWSWIGASYWLSPRYQICQRVAVLWYCLQGPRGSLMKIGHYPRQWGCSSVHVLCGWNPCTSNKLTSDFFLDNGRKLSPDLCMGRCRQPNYEQLQSPFVL